MAIVFHQEYSLVEFVWSDETKDLEDYQFRDELKQQVKAVTHYEAKNVLIDTRKFIFPIDPDTQVWIDEEVYPSWAKKGVKKIGLLMSPELIAQLSIEQAIDENSQEDMTSRFFDLRDDVITWFQQ